MIGACLARCSQPEVGWLGWRSTNDENLVQAILDACAWDRDESNKKKFKSNSNKLPSESESYSSHPSSSLSTLSNEKVINLESYFLDILVRFNSFHSTFARLQP